MWGVVRAAPSVAVLVLAGGCLPTGPAPAGVHVLHTRAAVSARFVPASSAGAPARLLVFESTRKAMNVSRLLVGDLGPDGLPGPLRPLGDSLEVNDQGVIDARGRLVIQRAALEVNQGVSTPLLRIDLGTGGIETLGMVSGFVQISPGGRRIVAFTEQFEALVIDADDAVTRLPGLFQPVLVGDDLYYLATTTAPGESPAPAPLRVLRADRTTTEVAQAVSAFSPVGEALHPLLLFGHNPPGPDQGPLTLLNPETGVQRLLPGEDQSFRSYVLSPDRRRLALIDTKMVGDSSTVKLHVLDLKDGGREDVDVVSGASYIVPQFSWRPAHDEAWLGHSGKIVRWRPGAGLSELGPGFLSQGAFSDFSSDGSRWLFVVSAPNQSGSFNPVYVASADDPFGPRLQVNPPGTGVDGITNLPDGRLLVQSWITLPGRDDLAIVDPRLGTVRPLASGGHPLFSGAHRSLCLLHFVEKPGTGTLTLIDLDSGAQTALAENVFEARISIEAADPLAPGAPMSFVVRSQLESPYDGLWVTPLP
jgi:hypothetical protein